MEKMRGISKKINGLGERQELVRKRDVRACSIKREP